MFGSKKFEKKYEKKELKLINYFYILFYTHFIYFNE